MSSEICSKLTIKTPERRHCRLSGVLIAKFEKILNLVLVFLLRFELNGSNSFPDNIYLLKVENKDTRKRYEICSKSTITIPLLIFNIFRTFF